MTMYMNTGEAMLLRLLLSFHAFAFYTFLLS